MRLDAFIKTLFNEPTVKGYELGQIEIDVGVREGSPPVLTVNDKSPCAKITIVSQKKGQKES